MSQRGEASRQQVLGASSQKGQVDGIRCARGSGDGTNPEERFGDTDDDDDHDYDNDHNDDCDDNDEGDADDERRIRWYRKVAAHIDSVGRRTTARSSPQIARVFEYFPKLPPEIRCAIWNLAMPPSIHIPYARLVADLPYAPISQRLPPEAHTCREAYFVACQSRSFVSMCTLAFGYGPERKWISAWVDPILDNLYIDMRVPNISCGFWSASNHFSTITLSFCDSLEVYELREWFEALGARGSGCETGVEVQRVQLVQNSYDLGADDGEGSSFEPLAIFDLDEPEDMKRLFSALENGQAQTREALRGDVEALVSQNYTLRGAKASTAQSLIQDNEGLYFIELLITPTWKRRRVALPKSVALEERLHGFPETWQIRQPWPKHKALLLDIWETVLGTTTDFRRVVEIRF